MILKHMHIYNFDHTLSHSYILHKVLYLHIYVITYLEIIYSKTFANFQLKFAKYIYMHMLNLYNDTTRTWLKSEVIVCVELGIKVIFAYEYAVLYINVVFETR